MLNTWIDNAENRFVTCLINNQLKAFSTKKKNKQTKPNKIRKKTPKNPTPQKKKPIKQKKKTPKNIA